MRPLRLEANTLPSFYSGAGRIAGFRHDPSIDATHAEDWIASTTNRFGTTETGRTRLSHGQSLADSFAADPQAWFGPEYTARYGARGALLVKLLDAGSRLPLHVHPDRDFARSHLDSDFGKSEAWLVLHADPGAEAHLGFHRDVSAVELSEWVRQQDIATLLGACSRVSVQSGDVIFCPGGVPHAIGAGMLILEIQEMTDFSIMLEWAGFPLNPADVFLGLDRDVALGAVDRNAIVGADLDALRGQCIRSLAAGAPGTTTLLPSAAATLFHAEQVIAVDHAVSLDARFAILVVNEGSGELRCADDIVVPVSAGVVYLLPFAAGPSSLSGTVSAIRCYPA